MKLYVAGPMSGYPDLNFPLFHRVAAELRAKGHEVVNPAEVNVDPSAGWLECMRADIAELIHCEGIVMLPDWRNSKGATIEHGLAQGLGFKVMTLEDLL